MKKNFLILGLIGQCALAQVPAIQFSPTLKTIDADALAPFSERYAVVVKGASHAMIDTKGSFFIPYNKYQFGGTFKEEYWSKGSLKKYRVGFNNGRCFVVNPKSGDIGMMDRTQKLLVPFQHGAPYILDNYILKMELQGGRKQHYLWDGTPLFVPQGQDSEAQQPKLPRGFSYQTADIESKRLWAFENYYTGRTMTYALTDYSGRFITEPIFEEINPFSEGLAVVMKRNEFKEEKWGVIDTNGKTVIDFIYSFPPSDFHDGLSIVTPNSYDLDLRYAFINRAGEVVLKIKNVEKGPEVGHRYYGWTNNLFFSDGRLLLRKPKYDPPHLLLYDKTGKSIDLEEVAKNEIKKWGLGNAFKQGYGVGTLNYQDGILYYSIFSPISLHDGCTGMIDILNGEFSLPPIYSSLRDFDPISGLTLAKAKTKGKEIEGYINTKGVFEIVKGVASKW